MVEEACLTHFGDVFLRAGLIPTTGLLVVVLGWDEMSLCCRRLATVARANKAV